MTPPASGTSLVTPLGPGGEFDRIRAILGADRSADAGGMTVGPGDDAAVLGDLVFSTDLTVEDVHFRREWMDLETLGHRAVTVALSDLGAMGAEPVFVLLSLAVPDLGIEPLRRLGDGARRAITEAGARLAGGDLSRSPGPLVIDVIAVGRSRDPVLRSTASPGDDVWVSGTLGGAAGAVAAWTEGRTPDEELRRAYERPDPPLPLLGQLRAAGLVSAGIDVSDGLLADAGHLAAASDVCLRIRDEAVPVHPGLEGLPPGRRFELALTGGEDYQLLFTAPQESRGALEARAGGAVPLSRIGTVAPGSGVVRVAPDGGEHAVEHGGFDHFAGAGT